MTRLIALPDLPTAIVATNDIFAAGGMIARLNGQDYEAFQKFPIEVVYRGSTAPPQR